MGDFRLPASGDVNQVINPWTWIYNTQANQVGLLNLSVNLGHSSNPDMEQAVLRTASYGKQLGRIEDVIDILIKELAQNFAPDSNEAEAISDYQTMRREIAAAAKSAAPTSSGA